MAKKADEAKNAKLMDDRAKALETTLASLEKQFGKGTVMKLGEQAHMKVDVVPTGCLELDLALGVGDGRMPLLQDLYEELLKQPEPEARRVATALELYCTGSLNLFNHPTNVKTDCRVVCIVLKGMGDNLRKIAMHVTNEFVNSSVNTNYQSGISTWCYFDEFHVLLRDQLTASYFVSIWQMLRKRGCVPSALTQNVKHLLASPEIQNILDNTDFMILLSQAQSDRAILAKQFGISEHKLSYITHSNSGEGLLFYGNVTIPFMDRFPRGEIYDLLTTRPEDLKDGAAG